MPVNIRVNLAELQKELENVSDRTEDLNPVWEELDRSVLPPEFDRLFRSRGYGAWPTQLIDTGRLKNSFTRPNADHIDRRTPDSFEYGSAVPYAIYYETQILFTFIEKSPVEQILRRLTDEHLRARR